MAYSMYEGEAEGEGAAASIACFASGSLAQARTGKVSTYLIRYARQSGRESKMLGRASGRAERAYPKGRTVLCSTEVPRYLHACLGDVHIIMGTVCVVGSLSCPSQSGQHRHPRAGGTQIELGHVTVAWLLGCWATCTGTSSLGYPFRYADVP